ncbi:MAG: multidrug efflux SMR transporter [Euryarchaeota archaeon]|nr:multidrug efflux SMR transporter [Euryarchaeota archaeon]
MAWIYLVIAGIFEISWVVGLKFSEGFTKIYPTIFTGITMVLSFIFLSFAVKTLPIGTAYAVWTGIGAIGTVILGIFFFKESSDILRIVCIGAIIFGVVGLKFLGEQ